MIYKLFKVILLSLACCFAVPQAFATFSVVTSLPINFNTVNPCNGEEVKISGTASETVRATATADLKNKIVTIEHDFSNVTAIGVASAEQYQFVTTQNPSTVQFPASGGATTKPGPQFTMTPKSKIVPPFTLNESMEVSLDKNGIGMVGFDQFSNSCPHY